MMKRTTRDTTRAAAAVAASLRAARAGALAFCAAALWAGAAEAQDFVKVNEAARENIPAVPFVGIAYGFIWVAILVYVVVVARRIARVNGELEDLRRRLSVGGVDTGTGAGRGGAPSSRP